MDEPQMNQENQTGESIQQSSIPAKEKSGGLGPVVGIIIIVAVLVIGGFYYWGARLNEQGEVLEEDQATQELLEQGTSDEVSTIEEDLGNTDLEGLDAELSDIESELGL